MKKLVLGALILIFLFCGTNAFAVTFGFNDIPDDDGIDFINNFWVDVDDVGDGSVQFTFRNEGVDDLSFIGGKIGRAHV